MDMFWREYFLITRLVIWENGFVIIILEICGSGGQAWVCLLLPFGRNLSCKQTDSLLFNNIINHR